MVQGDALFSTPSPTSIVYRFLADFLWGDNLTVVLIYISLKDETLTSLLSSSIRGQTEEATIIPQPPAQKPQSRKANQNDHMDDSFV